MECQNPQGDLLANDTFNNRPVGNSARSSFTSLRSKGLGRAHLASPVPSGPCARPPTTGRWAVPLGGGAPFRLGIHLQHQFRAALQLCPLGRPPFSGKITRPAHTALVPVSASANLDRGPWRVCGAERHLRCSPSATADTSSCSARISLASLVRYWQRRSSCCSTVAMRRERVCRQFITDGSALACGRGHVGLRRHPGTADPGHEEPSLPFPHSPLQVPPWSPALCPLQGPSTQTQVCSASQLGNGCLQGNQRWFCGAPQLVGGHRHLRQAEVLQGTAPGPSRTAGYKPASAPGQAGAALGGGGAADHLLSDPRLPSENVQQWPSLTS